MTRIIISILFYTLVTPTAIIGRLLGYHFIDRSWGKQVDSHWKFRGDIQNVNDHDNQY